MGDWLSWARVGGVLHIIIGEGKEDLSVRTANSHDLSRIVSVERQLCDSRRGNMKELKKWTDLANPQRASEAEQRLWRHGKRGFSSSSLLHHPPNCLNDLWAKWLNSDFPDTLKISQFHWWLICSYFHNFQICGTKYVTVMKTKFLLIYFFISTTLRTAWIFFWSWSNYMTIIIIICGGVFHHCPQMASRLVGSDKCYSLFIHYLWVGIDRR